MQSVREVQRVDGKRFMFEIIMTNGKRKMLAAETAALRQQWVGHLWQAMHLSTSTVSKSTHLEVHEQRDRVNSSVAMCSHSDRVTESLPVRPLSAPAPTGHIHHHHHHEHSSVPSTFDLHEGPHAGEATYENTLPTFQHHSGDSLDGLDSPEGPSWLSNAEERQEGDYDVLPCRRMMCEISAPPEMDDGVYDIPALCRRVSEPPEPTENIYDVPSSLLRMVADCTSEEEHMEDGPYWRI